MTQQTLERSLPVENTIRHFYCSRCGIEMSANAMAKRIERGSTNTQCPDCNYSGTNRPSAKFDGTKCKPWSGEIDLDTFAPLNVDGSLYMPGERRCGKSDCVNKSHVKAEVSAEALIAERFSIYYRTGIKRNYGELLKTVRQEARKGEKGIADRVKKV